MTLLADTDGKVAEAYDVLMSVPGVKVAKRGYFLVDKDGIIRYKYLNKMNLLNPGGGDPYEWSPENKPGEMKELPRSSETLLAEIDKLP